ncbi:hypothetical protein GLAREA_00997 [Glarea lozoyensis ATCC 20868]|uniref:Uncharacterized protein n=2 Tax=Glarea lozoyensis TaxID=101852 RepID=S3CTX9_GLAL2|nr:uncharacterized protein GLAREA_00997 [Glarea lozoyensis ATCC 20868]EPE29837.1 hypothetical protein GLAREA_00997 [Glarea lozoyensis ATCC 20868]
MVATLVVLSITTYAMASTTFTNQTMLFGRGGYNGPASSSEDEDNSRPSAPLNFGRGGYNRGGDDDEEEDGRGGYN